MAVTNPDHRKLTKSLMYMENMSFDPVHEVSARIGLSINPISGAPERTIAIQGNGSLALSYDGSGNLTTLAKTIGATTYSKTFTWTGGNLTAITAWS